MDDTHPLTTLFNAVEARTGAQPQTRDNTALAMDAYCLVAQRYPDVEPIARAGMAQLAPRVRADAKATLIAIADEPANGEAAYLFSMSELSNLATVFVSLELNDEFAGEYRDVCAVLSEMMSISPAVAGLWQAERARRVVSRAHPPPRAQPATPLADDNEYYIGPR
jgi:hypothetical protein